ncbi:INO80 complex, subunit Ies4 [Apiosordaria backusii]|uniref:INO80 complex, subunit Ies4 n=1 Tax=Apiosordaria backusii TaxID=314023 RepID=A0AA40ETV8_9PEZI|nr:INO80 complex, subunit Ies4 [Apiosordaria backusii]
MAPSSKSAAAAKDRRKSNNSPGLVTLRVPSAKLRAIVDPDYVKEDSPVKESPATSTTLPAATVNSNTENASDSSPNTPATGTPAPPSVSMGPPAEGPKKKGVKRGVAALNGEPKVRGKPGPKKKQRLEDGTIEGGRASLGAHKLGPKANQGAINAGLRALDRSGKPCRKWNRGGFTMKSFTGVVWEIPRWVAPPKVLPETATDSSTSTPASVDGSSKENKDTNSQQLKSDTSNNGGDVEMTSAPPSISAAPSPAPPAPAPIAAAS